MKKKKKSKKQHLDEKNNREKQLKIMCFFVLFFRSLRTMNEHSLRIDHHHYVLLKKKKKKKIQNFDNFDKLFFHRKKKKFQNEKKKFQNKNTNHNLTLQITYVLPRILWESL